MKKPSFRNQLLFASLLITLCSGVGCKKSDATPNSGSNPGTNEVWMQNLVFSPGSITVAVNTTIKWTNKDGTAHTVTGSGLFNSGNIGSGGSYSHQFTIKGTYPYTCTIHSGMNGTVIVQ